MDFAKAFDRLSHEHLAAKLESIGLFGSLLAWLRDYLTGRTMVVQIRNARSHPSPATSGVPHWSHLGPLLFLVLIDSVLDSFINTPALLFADYLKLFNRVDAPGGCQRLQDSLVALSFWCDQNSLHLNPAKCTATTFCRGQRSVVFTYMLGDAPLRQMSLRYQVRDLYRRLRRKGYPKDLFQDYSKLKSKYVRVLRQAKREFFDRHQRAINDCKNSRGFRKIVKTIKKKPYCENPVPLREWEASYKGIYKPKSLGSVWPSTLQLVTGLDEVITLQELEKVLCHIKNGKAPGEDAIPNDVLKILPKNWKQYPVDLFNHILAAGEVAVGWGRVKLYLLHKKGDQADPSNYIALMSTIVKVFTTILADRLTSWANVRGVLPEEQAGFRAKRSCTDHTFTLHAAACLCPTKKIKPLVMVMVDLKRAFDSVCHDKLGSKLEKIGVSGRIIRDLVSLYSSACFLIQSDPQGERFEQDITEGVLQGDCLSPLLFILFLSDLGPFMDERGCHGLRIGGKELSQLIFAEDLAVLVDSVPDAQHK
ncbi:unnamed protein product, partial [Nesidiocoris tenuis]